MSDQEREFEEFVRRLRFDDAPDRAHRDKLEKELLAALEKQKRKNAGRPPTIWRTIMKSRAARVAAAAAVIIGIISAAYFTTRSPDGASVAWAVEQAIDALDDVKTVHMKGTADGRSLLGPELFKDRKDDGKWIALEIWARKGRNGFESGHLRMEMKDVLVIVVRGDVTYKHIVAHNQVNIVDGRDAVVSPWPGRDLLKVLEQKAQDWQVSEGKDDRTGKDCLYATCSFGRDQMFQRSWWFQFDAETNLLVRFKQWDNAGRRGTPQFDFQAITYDEELPDELFEFKIPEGASVIDKRVATLLADPDVGMSAEGLSGAEASAKIVREYWQAAVKGDWQLMGRLRPVAHEETRSKYSNNPPVEVLAFAKPRELRPKKSFAAPCKVRLEDGTVEELTLVVGLGVRDGKRLCVIIHRGGQPAPEPPATQSAADQ